MPYVHSAVIAATLIVCAGHASATSHVTFDRIAFTGDDAPGTEFGHFVGTYNYRFREVVVNASGEVAFAAAHLGNDGVVLGVWTNAGGQMHPAALEGDIVSATGDAFLYGFDNLTLSDDGEISALVRLDGDGVHLNNQFGIWKGSGVTSRLVVRDGDEAPGVPGAIFQRTAHYTRYNSSPSGEVGIYRTLEGPGINAQNDSGVWASRDGSLELRYREGDGVPGFTGAQFTSFNTPIVNAEGNLAIYAGIYDGSVAETWLFKETDGVLEPIIKRFGTMPDTNGGVLTTIQSALLSDRGDMAINARLQRSGADIHSLNDEGIWMHSAGSLRLIAREGDAAPGTGGALFAGMDHMQMNEEGDVAFVSFLSRDGDTEKSLWSSHADELRLIAENGAVAPGASGRTFNLHAFYEYAFNDLGQAAFEAPLSDPTGTDPDLESLWLYDPFADRPFLVVKEGDLFDIDPDPLVEDLREVASIGLKPADSFDNGSGLGADGTLAFELYFTDFTTGVFTATIPAPGALLLIPMALAVQWRRRVDSR